MACSTIARRRCSGAERHRLDAWNPGTDAALAQSYSSTTLQNRLANKRACRRPSVSTPPMDPVRGGQPAHLAEGHRPACCCIDELVASGGQLAVLGSGEAELENAVRGAAMRHPGRVGLVTGYNETLSHLVQGGADLMVVPSRFEPCGLTQLYALRYGCIPLVSRVGGLNDTVIDANVAALQAEVATGIQFGPAGEAALMDAIRRAFVLYADEKGWRKMQRRAMKADVSWTSSAARYADLYASLIGLRTDDQQTIKTTPYQTRSRAHRACASG